MPLDETQETARKFIEEDDEDEDPDMDYSSSDDEVNNESVQVEIVKTNINENVVDIWLYDKNLGPLQEELRMGYKVTSIEFKTYFNF